MSSESLDSTSRPAEANRRSLYLDDFDDEEPLIFKRTNSDYRYGKNEKTREFGGEEEEECCSVENDTETISLSSSNKRIRKVSIDRLSSLPDSVITRILSFLKMKEAVVTCVLSKRWQFLWTELPKLVFWESSRQTEKIREFVAMVHRTLVVRSGNDQLERVEVNFAYDKCFASDVNSWVVYAVKHKVKEVALLLNSCKDSYTLPQMMYSNSKLTWLRVRGCTIAPQRKIEWRFLNTLYVEEVELRQHVLEKIFSVCPVLGILGLTACWGLNCLDVSSQSLKLLLVEDCKDRNNEYLLEISAPYILCLRIWLHPEGGQLRLKNIQSVEQAHVEFSGFDWEASSVEVMSYTKEIFEKLQHVKDLELGRRCIEVLSLLVVNGWQLPQSARRKSLRVDALRDKQSIPGIVGLLQSSPNLDMLVIKGYDPCEVGISWDVVAVNDLNCDLLHLKTVNITNFANPNIAGEPMLTLAEILLKRAAVLEEMVVDVEEFSTFALSDSIKITQKLLGYKRSSQEAVVLLL